MVGRFFFRLFLIDPAYFKEIFECMYDCFSENYNQTEKDKYYLIRVDSTIVTGAAGKLKEVIDQKSGKKLIKYIL